MKPLLAVDRSMGRLAKWLRLLGYDTVFDPNMPDREFLLLARMERVLITRTRSLFSKADQCRMVTITASDPMDQLTRVVRELGLVLDREKLFTLCIRCNRKVAPINMDLVVDKVPDYILSSHNNFAACPDCGRIYWPGSHEDRGLALFKKVFPQTG